MIAAPSLSKKDKPDLLKSFFSGDINELKDAVLEELGIKEKFNKFLEAVGVKTKKELDDLENDVIHYEKLSLKEQAMLTQLTKELEKYNSPIKAKEVLNAATAYDVPAEYIMAIMKNDSHYGTQGLGAKNHNPGNVKQYDNIKGAVDGYDTRQEGVDAVAKNLQWRIKEYQKVYGTDKYPHIRYVVTNQGPDGKGFLSTQPNYKKDNPEREENGKKMTPSGAYMTGIKGPENVGAIVDDIRDSFSTIA